MDAADLKLIGIEPWEDLVDEFEDADLLLGNGFSIALSSAFRYDSLFEEFARRLKPSSDAILRSLGTTNFETILADLSTAARVNRAFSLPHERLEKARDVVRNGLIETVERIHPRADKIDWTKLGAYALRFDQFSDVYSLSYDALLYHIIMLRLDRYTGEGKGHPYNDYYWDKISDDYLRFRDFQHYKQYKHVYYLHGALFLFKKGAEDLKIRRAAGTELLDVIAEEIRAGQVPLFVSEGTAEEKELAISESEYLRFANRQLKDRHGPLVIFGCSFGEQDRHVVSAVQGTPDMAVSIYVGDKTSDELKDEIKRYRNELFRSTGNLHFYDATTLFG